MFGGKFDSENSLGRPKSPLFYTKWTQIHKFFVDVFA